MMIEGLSNKRVNRLPNDESRQTTSPDIPFPRNAVVSYINAGEEDQMVYFNFPKELLITSLNPASNDETSVSTACFIRVIQTVFSYERPSAM